MNGRVLRALLLSSLLLAVTPLAPAEAGGGCHSEESDTLATAVVGTEVEMKRNCFTPAVLAVGEGATVRFTNRDGIDHVVMGTRWGLAGEIAPGRTAEHQFLHRGTYPYSCYLHPGMNGVVLVGDPAPAALAASSAPASGSALQPLALGAIAGLALSSGVTRLRRRR
jgi:plastocyanin